MNKKAKKRIGPLIEGSELFETANPTECKFYIRLIFFYNLQLAYDYPICLHPEVCRSDSSTKPYFRTEDITCKPDSCPFIKKIEGRELSELTLEILDQEKPVQLPDEAKFHLAHQPTWFAPPADFTEKAIWELFSYEEAKKNRRVESKNFCLWIRKRSCHGDDKRNIRKKPKEDKKKGVR